MEWMVDPTLNGDRGWGIGEGHQAYRKSTASVSGMGATRTTSPAGTVHAGQQEQALWGSFPSAASSPSVMGDLSPYTLHPTR